MGEILIILWVVTGFLSWSFCLAVDIFLNRAEMKDSVIYILGLLLCMIPCFGMVSIVMQFDLLVYHWKKYD